jgi:hypothetical protein
MANMFAKLCKALLHEFHTSVGRIGTARTKPIVEALSGFSDEAQQGMVAFLSPFLWVIAFLGSLLVPADSSFGGVHIKGDFGKPFF